MGVMEKPVVTVLCALVLILQLLFRGECYQGVRIHGATKLAEHGFPRGLSGLQPHAKDVENTNVLRASLIHKDLFQMETNASTVVKSLSERFLEAVRRSRSRVNQLEKNLRRSDVEPEAATSLESPVSAGSGEYVMRFSLGTPAQRFTTIVDTGSDLCWVQCTPCTRCSPQPDPLFNPAASRTYSRVACNSNFCRASGRPSCSASGCTYSYGYGGGTSTRGDLFFETVTLDSSVPHIAFGCGHNQQGSIAGADGIVGLGKGTLSLPSQLSPSIPKIFSYCLVSLTSTGTSPIIFGNAAENSAAKYTPLISNAVNPSFYYVGVEGVSIGSQRVHIPASAFQIDSAGGGGTILDSGTTITLWKEAAFNAILAALRRQITYPEASPAAFGLELCYNVSGIPKSNLTFPKMVVHLTNVDFEIPAENLFWMGDGSAQTACLAMAASREFSIIGNFQQQNNFIVHDVVRQRVGFLATQCEAL